ncbi:hypothetical protein ACP3V3_16780 [Vibrio sp. PNB22_3_1]
MKISYFAHQSSVTDAMKAFMSDKVQSAFDADKVNEVRFTVDFDGPRDQILKMRVVTLSGEVYNAKTAGKSIYDLVVPTISRVKQQMRGS